MKNKVYLSLGSNVGDRKQNLMSAIEKILCLECTEIEMQSSVYETNPVGYTEQGLFLNMAVLITTCIRPMHLIKKLQSIEDLLARKRIIKWGPRTIDIDILLYDNLKLEKDDLILPHPRMHERAFVLIPLRDIYPDFILNDKSIDELLENCIDDEKHIRIYCDKNFIDKS
mgnify:CR=1 FL=1